MNWSFFFSGVEMDFKIRWWKLAQNMSIWSRMLKLSQKSGAIKIWWRWSILCASNKQLNCSNEQQRQQKQQHKQMSSDAEI